MRTQLIFLTFLFLIANQEILNAQIVINQNTAAASSGIALGKSAADVTITNLLNARSSSITLADLKGKVVVLEFWATWCAPCIPAMDELSELQKKYRDDLVVIGIAHEREERLKKYMANKPSEIWHAADETNSLYSQYFPHYTVPHSVLIDKQGNVAAITQPSAITEEVIQKLIAGKKISIPAKEEIATSGGFDYTKDYFPPAPGTAETFSIQPPINGAMPMVKKPSRGEYQNRRVTMMNQNLKIIYALIYNIPLHMVVFDNVDAAEITAANTPFRYCIEAIAPVNTSLSEYLQKKIAEADLEIKARIEKKSTSIWRLVTIPGQNVNLKKSDGQIMFTQGTPVVAHANEYKSKGVTLDQFTDDFLNRLSIQGMSVVNETNITGKFDFDFAIETEDPKSLRKELNKLGLTLEKGERKWIYCISTANRAAYVSQQVCTCF